MPRRCSCVDCVCKYSDHKRLKTVFPPKKLTSSESSYCNVESSTASKPAAPPTYPYSINVKPSIYYDEASATYSDETSNIYYKITDLKGKIKNSLLGALEYTKDREYFEKVEKLRFRLPTTADVELECAAPAEVLNARVKAVQKIREKYRDECVSRNQEEAAQHACVHRYQLNERRFPQPSLTDEDGNSLCSTCFTPSAYMMENNVSPLNCARRFTVPNHVGEDVKGQSHASPILVLEAPSDSSSSGSSFYKSKQSVPFPNSLALTHQRRMY